MGEYGLLNLFVRGYTIISLLDPLRFSSTFSLSSIGSALTDAVPLPRHNTLSRAFGEARIVAYGGTGRTNATKMC